MDVFAEEVIAPSQDGTPLRDIFGVWRCRNSLDYDCVHFTPAAAAADRAFNKAPSGGLMGKSGRDGDAGWDQGWNVRRISQAE